MFGLEMISDLFHSVLARVTSFGLFASLIRDAPANDHGEMSDTTTTATTTATVLKSGDNASSDVYSNQLEDVENPTTDTIQHPQHNQHDQPHLNPYMHHTRDLQSSRAAVPTFEKAESRNRDSSQYSSSNSSSTEDLANQYELHGDDELDEVL